MHKELNRILNKLENKEDNQQALGFEALALIDTLLGENPYDVDARVARMRLNTDWVFSNSQEIIQDASFIIENDAFKADKLLGYNWLTWVYDEVLSLPEKAIETIEEQLVETHSLYTERYIKDSLEGDLLDKMATINYNNDQAEKALMLWDKSFDKQPYNNSRNAFVGMLFLERKNLDKAFKFLQTHYNWSYGYEDGNRLKYGIKLQKLFKNNE